MAALTEAADAGAPCPSNAQLQDRLNFGSRKAVQDVIGRAERAGLIQVERFAESRAVTIVATGRRTAGTGTPVSLREFRARHAARKLPRRPKLDCGKPRAEDRGVRGSDDWERDLRRASAELLRRLQAMRG